MNALAFCAAALICLTSKLQQPKLIDTLRDVGVSKVCGIEAVKNSSISYVEDAKRHVDIAGVACVQTESRYVLEVRTPKVRYIESGTVGEKYILKRAESSKPTVVKAKEENI